MRALVLAEAPGSLELCELSVGDLGPREVLVRTAAAGLCHSDLHALEGSIPMRGPVVMGHEAAGIVAETGSQVTEVTVGDHVVACLSAGCGACEFCLTGRPFLCLAPDVHRVGARPYAHGTGRVGQFFGIGAFAEQMVVHERSLAVVPDQIPLDRAALLGCAVVTGVGAVCRTAAVPAGATVAVIGCGGVGLNCVQGAVLAGASRIVAVDMDAAKLELATRLGATDTVHSAGGDIAAPVRERVSGGVEYAFEAVGSPALIREAVAMLRPGGTATVIGLGPAHAVLDVRISELVTRGKKVQGSVMGSTRFKLDVPWYAELYLQGRLRLDELISARISLPDGDAALRRLHEGAVIRSVITM